MAKRPVIKQKTAKSRSKTRYASFKRKKLNKLEGIIAGAQHTFKKAEALKADATEQKQEKKVNKVEA